MVLDMGIIMDNGSSVEKVSAMAKDCFSIIFPNFDWFTINAIIA
jgi:hypothetical protein